MIWNEFAEKIRGEYKDNSQGFISGGTILKLIVKEDNHEQIRIQKEERKSYGASSHFNVEKFEIEYSNENQYFGKARITRKSILGRIGRQTQNQYQIEGDNQSYFGELLQQKELEYLLNYPKSEFIIIRNSIKFKSQSLGKMNEELENIFNSFIILKNKINTAANKG